MHKGFTLLELIVVIIIIGILATLGITQYTKIIERSRSAEAKQILGAIRTNCAAIYMQYNNDATNCAPGGNGANIGIGTDYPGPGAANCAASHYFYYAATSTATGITSTATRCVGATGKQPGGTAPAGTVILTTDFSTGADTWTSTGGY